jgi:hypothetical protein
MSKIIHRVFYVSIFVLAGASWVYSYHVFHETLLLFKSGGEGYWTTRELVLFAISLVLSLIGFAYWYVIEIFTVREPRPDLGHLGAQIGVLGG